jgi:hypothetical protein
LFVRLLVVALFLCWLVFDEHSDNNGTNDNTDDTGTDVDTDADDTDY